MTKRTEVPGNAMESHVRFQELLLRDAETFHSMEKTADALFEQGVEIVSIRVRFPVGEGGGYLGVVKAVGPDGAKIGFHDGTTFVEVVLGIIRRLQQNSMKWRDDEHAT